MSSTRPLAGVWTACLTPFAADGAIDHARFAEHCKAMIAEGSGVSLFGTTGEGTAISPEERIAALDRVIEAGVAPERIIPGIGFCDVPTSVRVIEHAVRKRCAAVLILPPFYMKGVSEDGLFRHFAEVIEKSGTAELRVLLYNFPDLTGLVLPPSLLRRLADRYPGTVIGIKDSSADWDLSQRYLAAAGADLSVFLGDERSLLANLRHGGAGTIAGLANVIGPALLRVVADPAKADAVQAQIAEVVSVVTGHPFVAASKSMMAARTGHAGWSNVRAPLDALPAEVGRTLIGKIAAIGL